MIDPAIGRFKISKSDFLRSFTGVWISVSQEGEPDTSFIDSVQTNRALRSFWNRGLWSLVFALGLGQAASILIAWSIQGLSVVNNNFAFATIMLVVIVGLYTLSTLFLSKSQRTLTQKFEENYSHPLFNGVLSQKFIFFKQYTVGGLLELIGLRGTIRDNILNNGLPAAINFITVFVLIGYIAFISPIIAITVSLISVFYIAVSSFAVKNEQYASVNYMQEQVSFSSKMQENLSNIIETKALKTESLMAARWVESNRNLYLSFIDTLRAQNLSTLVRNVFYAVIIIIVAISSLLLYERDQITVGSVVVLQAMTGMLAGSINSLQIFLTAVARSQAYERRQYNLWSPTNHISKIVNTSKSSDRYVSSDIIMQLNNVSYAYPHRPAVFENLYLSVKKGEKVAIIGASGTGKSTLLHLMLGLLDPGTGEFHSTFNSHRKLGVVLSGMELQQSSLRENLTYDGNFSDHEILDALQVVGLDSLVKTLPLGLDSAVLHNGSNFSSGQSQRF